MSIWNKILIGFLIIASGAFFYLSSRVLKTHQYWRSIAAKQQDQLDKEEKRRKLLIEGAEAVQTEAEMGIRQFMLELHKVLVDRGRVWRGAVPQQVELAKEEADVGGAKVPFDTVKVLLQIEFPESHQIEKDANLVLFEERDVQEGGRYLGRFTVEAVAGKQLQLKPSLKLNQREIKRLRESRDKWCVYEIMPIDDHEIFAGAEGLDKLIPADRLAEYVKDGQPTDPNNKESGKFERKLRDYEVLYTAFKQHESNWTEQMAAATHDKAYIDAGLELAKKEVEECQKDVAKLKDEVAQLTRERDAVAAHRKAVEAKLAEVQEAFQQTVARNAQLAGSIADIQLKATQVVDARTRKMARAVP